MAEDCTPLAPSGGCDIAGLQLHSTGKRLPKDTGGGHEFVTELPETGDDGVEYVLMDDISDCSTYRGTFVYNKDCGGWIQTSGSGGGTIERYTFEQTPNGWRAKRNNTVIFTYVDKDTIDSYENTADGFQITRNGVVIFTHTDGGGGDCKEYTITATADGWVFKEDGVTKFTYTEPANDPSDGTYFTSGTLTTAITGTTTVAASSVTGLTLADVVIGETLIYNEAGTVGRVTAVNGTNLTVETITTAPGERRGTRLGAVDDYTDLPATCAAAVAMGWQTPLAGDFVYVREDTSHDSHLTEWVISSIDSSCNITWDYSHTLNAGNYVLDIYEYGQYPSGSPLPKNLDGSVTLPKDNDTQYDFENVTDSEGNVLGWKVKDHETGATIYTYTDLNDGDTTYTFANVTDDEGNITGWNVTNDKTGAVVYTHADGGGEDNVIEIIKLSDGTALAVNPADKSVTLPDFTGTTYTFEETKDSDGNVTGWKVTDDNTGTVVFTYTDIDTTYTFENTTTGWKATNNRTGVAFYHSDPNALTDGEDMYNRGRVYFVDADNGDDSNDGSYEHPFETLQKAVNQAAPYYFYMPENPFWSAGSTGIYVNTAATAHYKPVYVYGKRCYFYGYDAENSTGDTVADGLVITNNTGTLYIDAEAYECDDHPGTYIYPGCWHQQYSYVNMYIANLNFSMLTGGATCFYVGLYSVFDHGTDADQNNGVKYTVTINANKTTTTTTWETNSTTGWQGAAITTADVGCEGIGVHNHSHAFFRGTVPSDSQMTINASNWGIGSSDHSGVWVRGKATVYGGYRTASNAGAVYTNVNGYIRFESTNASTSDLGQLTFEAINANGAGYVLGADQNSTLNCANPYQNLYIRKRATNTAVGNCVYAGYNAEVTVLAYNNLQIINQQVTGRGIYAFRGGTVRVGTSLASGTYTIAGSNTGSPTTSGEAICATEQGRISVTGGSGTTLPSIKGRVGYAAWTGGQLSYTNLGKFTAVGSSTSQRSTSAGGRIYTGAQSSIGAY